jgi:response regulator receiver domain
LPQRFGEPLENSILLITDNEKVSKLVKAKVLLLRNSDVFESVSTKDCLEKVKEKNPVLIFYHLTADNEEEFLNFVQKIRQNDSTKTCSVILLFEEFDENTLCSAYEKGITDFLTLDATETEFTIRTLWCLKKRENLYESQNKKDILSQLKILDKNNQVYTENYTYTILKEESKKDWGTFVVAAPDINIRSKISPENLMNTIKKTVRSCDILGYASDFKIYLWFRHTTKEDVLKVLEKIRTALTADFTICAGYIETKDIAFDRAEELANKALSKALLKGNSFLFAQEPVKKEVNLEVNVKNFKLHKENFVKKLENILSPLFYQTQKRNEEKLFETKITQTVTEERGNFSLKNEKGESFFTVSYPGYTKINVEIIHNIKNQDLKAEKLFVDTNELSEEKLEYLLNSFIKDFQTYTND